MWTLGRGGDTGFFRPVDPAVRLAVVPFRRRPSGEGVGRADPALHRRAARGVRPGRGYDIVHAQDCISANAVGRCLRTVHHIDQFTTPELAACHERAIVEPYAHVCVSAAVAAELEAGWGITATVIPNGVDAARFAAAAEPGTGRRRGPAALAGPARPVRAGRRRHRAAQGLARPAGGLRPAAPRTHRTSGW